MNTKLTLSIDKKTIEKAKDYAKGQNLSLSGLIENYLNTLTTMDEKPSKVSPLVESLTGVIPSKSDKDIKKEYYQYLNKKYS